MVSWAMSLEKNEVSKKLGIGATMGVTMEDQVATLAVGQAATLAVVREEISVEGQAATLVEEAEAIPVGDQEEISKFGRRIGALLSETLPAYFCNSASP